MDQNISPRPDVVLTNNQLASCFVIAGVDISPERLAANAEVYRSTLTLIRRASVAGLGETPPAISFNASWL